MNAMKGKPQADREGYVQQPPEYDELDYRTRPPPSQPFPEPQTGNETGGNCDVAPTRRLRQLITGNFTNRVLTLAMSIAAVILDSNLVRRQGNDFHMSQKMVLTQYYLISRLHSLMQCLTDNSLPHHHIHHNYRICCIMVQTRSISSQTHGVAIGI